MIERGEKFLPIGTVAMLRGGTKRVMITGFCSVNAEDPEKIWDYSGCMYPEGFLSSEQTCLFDHDQIIEIFHLGLIDEEENQFKENIKKFLNSMQNNTNPQVTAESAPEQ